MDGFSWVKVEWVNQVQPDSLQQILDKHSDLFEKTVGTIQGYTADVRLKPEAKQIFKKRLSVPYNLQDTLDYELRFLHDGTSWLKPMGHATGSSA